jgi:hypothetical protein
MSPTPSLLELLHPDGTAGSVTVMGDACPDALRPAGAPGAPPWGVILVAPSPRQGRSAPWIEQTAGAAARGLAADGLVYLLAGALARWRLARALRRAGLTTASGMLHLQRAPGLLLLVGMDREAFGATLDRLVSSRARRQALRLASGPVGLELLRRAHPSAALLVRRPGSRPVGEWLAAAGGLQSRWRMADLRLRRTAARDRVSIHLVGERGPGVFAKLSLRGEDESARIEAEARNIRELGPAAQAAGVVIPSGEVISLSGSPVLVQRVLGGRPAAGLLGDEPNAFEPLMLRLTEWLEHWGHQACVRRPASGAFLQTLVLDPARRLSASLEGGHSYADWLESRCRELQGAVLPLIPAHNDLTMSNVLVGPDRSLGVVDWEAATPEALPLLDFYYAALDATAARSRYRNRAVAYSRCFVDANPTAEIVRRLGDRLQAALGVSDQLATLAFHACWLQHAENERRKRAPGEPTPFLGYLRRAARGVLAAVPVA